MSSQARLVFFLVDEDADGVISRDELRNFVATCLDANLLRPQRGPKRLLTELQSTSHSSTVTLGVRGDPSYAPPQWCFDEAEDIADDVMDRADANHDGVLDEHEFSQHVAPLIYQEMCDHGFQASATLASGTSGPACDFNVLLHMVQDEEKKKAEEKTRNHGMNGPGGGGGGGGSGVGTH